MRILAVMLSCALCVAAAPADGSEIAPASETADAPVAIDGLLEEGQSLRAQGRVGDALAAFLRAQELARGAGDVPREIAALAGRAAVLRARGSTGEAAALLDVALERARSAGVPEAIATIQNERANLLAADGLHADAAALYARAAELARAQGDPSLAHRAVANGLRSRVAALAGNEGNRAAELRAAIGAELEALAARSNDSEAAQLTLHLGRTLERLAARVGDRRARLDAGAAFTTAAQRAAAAQDWRTASFAWTYLADLYATDGRDEDALELAQRGLAAAEAADAPDAQYRALWQIGRASARLLRTDPAVDAYRRATTLLAALRSATGVATPSVSGELEQMLGELIEQLLYRASFTEDPVATQSLLREARDRLEDLKYAELQDYFEDPCVTEPRAIGAIPRTLVVYPVVLEQHLALIVERDGELAQHRIDVNRDRLAATVRETRQLLQKPTTDQYLAPAQTLYDWLARPLLERLDLTQIDALVFVPGGMLRTIPLGALRDRDSGRFLVQQVPVALTPGLRLTDPRPIDSRDVPLLAAGLTESVQGYPALPSVGAELASVRESFTQTRALVDASFTGEGLREQLDRSPFGIMHLASHAEFRSEVSQSYLLTYDDRLSMGELSDMVTLAQGGEQPLELLTLSACETAAGDERAALGLAGVAVRVGARSALGTLWSVNDEVAAELISDFYAKLGQPGVSRARALQLAQVAMIERHGLAHPYYWAPFVLINSWL